MTHDAVDPQFRSLVDEHAAVRRIGSGFRFTEGPIWHPTEHYLLFSDMPGDTRRRWDEKGGVRVEASPSNKGNGMTRDREQNLLVCEHATSAVVRFGADGKRNVLATHFEGKELNSPNDIVVAPDEAVLFTDPTYGRMPGYGVERPCELDFRGVFRIPPGGGAPQLLTPRPMFGQPNGLCFSPDETLLYINDTEQTNIRVFAFEGDRIRLVKVFAEGIADPDRPGVPDGLKCDEAGNVWVTAPGGLWVYAPDGKLMGKVVLPELCANFHWGGRDWRTLFAAASTSLYALEVKIGPHREPFMRAGG